MRLDAEITLRRAQPADAAALRRVAELDSTPQPDGEVLVVEEDGAILAWTEVATGRCAADPFHRTAHLVRLLELRVEQAREAARERKAAVARLAHHTGSSRRHAVGRPDPDRDPGSFVRSPACRPTSIPSKQLTEGGPI